MPLDSNEVVERSLSLRMGLSSFSKEGTCATQLLVKSSNEKEETIAVPGTATMLHKLYTLTEINLIYSIHVAVCDVTSTHLTCMR